MKGRRFRRQHSIGNIIVDFFCFAENMIIEVDGTVHDSFASEMDDNDRDNYLEKKGFKILRFKAIEIKDNLEAVLEKVVENFNIKEN
jgi:very-short-patch-repair endonuclease